jgi:hypothetical protein
MLFTLECVAETMSEAEFNGASTLLISRLDFAVNSISIPVIRQLYPVNCLGEFREKPLRHSHFSDGKTASKAEKSRTSLLNSLRTGKCSVETGFAGLHPPPPKSKTWPDRNENEAVVFDQLDAGKTESVGALTSQSSKNIHLLRDRQRAVTASAIAFGIK